MVDCLAHLQTLLEELPVFLELAEAHSLQLVGVDRRGGVVVVIHLRHSRHRLLQQFRLLRLLESRFAFST